jgi:photosystem II stability/assembly factor-like uncharacterized protein
VWAAGTTGTLIQTTDGSKTSQAQSLDTDVHLFDVTLAGVNRGWGVGEQGMVLQTENGGATWITQTSGITQALRSVFFLDGLVGWAVGDDALLHTVRGLQS